MLTVPAKEAFFILFSVICVLFRRMVYIEAYIENKVCCIDFGLASNMGLGFVCCLFLKACNKPSNANYGIFVC